jgi:hypothetical protein
VIPGPRFRALSNTLSNIISISISISISVPIPIPIHHALRLGGKSATVSAVVVVLIGGVSLDRILAVPGVVVIVIIRLKRTEFVVRVAAITITITITTAIASAPIM